MGCTSHHLLTLKGKALRNQPVLRMSVRIAAPLFKHGGGGRRRQFFMYSFLTKRPFPFHLKLSIHFLPCTPPPPTFSPLNLDLDFVYCQEAVGVPACVFAQSAKPLCIKFRGEKNTQGKGRKLTFFCCRLLLL